LRKGAVISADLRINDRIRVSQVRLIGYSGEQVGIVDTATALNMADEVGLDLVEISPDANPPVCKIMDFGKYKYEIAQKAREARQNQTHIVVKEMRLGLKIEPHDYETKRNHIEKFLKGGDKVKVTVQFRGREQARPEMGYRLLMKLAEELTEVAVVEFAPKKRGTKHDNGSWSNCEESATENSYKEGTGTCCEEGNNSRSRKGSSRSSVKSSLIETGDINAKDENP